MDARLDVVENSQVLPQELDGHYQREKLVVSQLLYIYKPGVLAPLKPGLLSLSRDSRVTLEHRFHRSYEKQLIANTY